MDNYDRNKIIKDISERTRGNKKVVFVSGNFNVVHPGHLRLLRFAKENGEFLVVGVNERSNMSIEAELRLESINSIDFIDYGFILREPIVDFLASLKPQIVVKGSEHENRHNDESDVLKDYGGKLLFGSGDSIFSSMEILKKELNELNLSTINKPTEYLDRHNITPDYLHKIIHSFSDITIGVIGDIIIDEYIQCNALGMSREDPTIVLTPVMHEKFLGGSAIVAGHARRLGANVKYFSVLGRDETAKYAKDQLDRLNVECYFHEDPSRPTTLKQRFRSSDKTMLRVSHLRQHHISQELIESLFKTVKQNIQGCQVLIFSDFNYGVLPQVLVDRIIEYCKENQIMMVADSQSSSQIGDVSRFKGVEYITPTEREARLAVRDFESGLVVLAEKLRLKADTKHILLTLGAEGLLLHAELNKQNKWLTDRLPAFNTAPRDTAGAGDSMLTASTLACCVSSDIWASAYIGCLAAAIQVSRVGNQPLEVAELIQEI